MSESESAERRVGGQPGEEINIREGIREGASEEEKFAYHGPIRDHGREDTVEFIDVVKRFGRNTVLDGLNRSEIVRILTEPRNAILRQYQRLFAMEGARLEFTADAMEAIAEVALSCETGVRALRSIVEDLLLDLLYELPDRKDERVFVVDGAVVRRERPLARGLSHPGTPESGEDAAGDVGLERESA